MVALSQEKGDRQGEGRNAARIHSRARRGRDRRHFRSMQRGDRRLFGRLRTGPVGHRIVGTAVGGFLVRQYIHSSLYDRLR